MRLLEGVETYVCRKRSGGLSYDKPASNLHGFTKQVGDVPLDRVTVQHVLDFLAGPRTSTTTWRKKHSILKHFFEFWASRGAMPPFLMPPIRPPCRQTFVPYIYTRAEIHTLLATVRVSQKPSWCKIDAPTFRTLLLTLYGTGALTGEILRLSREDVALNKGLVTIRGNRFGRSRCIPIGCDLREILRIYLNSKRRRQWKSEYLFVTKCGQPVVARSLNANFQRLRTIAGIARYDGAVYQPRMHDLRSTFAVHRITSWIRNGADLNRMLPALSAYMGQVGLNSVDR